MKKRVLALLLCFSLLPFGSVYAAGSAEDPFISKSYIDGTFIPAVESVVKALLETLKGDSEEAVSPSTGMVVGEVSAGKDIVLSAGQSIILLSGSAKISKDKGSIVNATMGLEASSGTIYKNHRYIICEDSAATAHILSDSTVYMSESAEIKDGEPQTAAPATPTPSAAPSAPSTTYPVPSVTASPTPTPTPAPVQSAAPTMPFTDVKTGNRYYKAISAIYEKGLINGMTPTLFAPGNELSLAQTLKLAACIHQLNAEGSISLESGSIWYESYLNYCLEKGIIDSRPFGINEPVTRREFVEIIYNALPESSYEAINIIPEGSLGDVDAYASWGSKVYKFYRAGILTGVTEDSLHSVHDFVPDDSITRAEAASVINRMLDENARIPFVLS